VTEVYMPQTPEALWEMMDARPDAVLYAGGTDVLVHRRAGLIQPRCLICLERMQGWDAIQEEPEGVWIGALATHSRIAEHEGISKRIPVLVQAVSSIGSVQIRHMGTLGGNICTASPAGDSLPALTVLEAEVELARRGSVRRVPVEQFINGPGKTDRKAGEALSRIWVPWPKGPAISRYCKVGRRQAMACAVVSLAAMVSLTQDNRISEARLAWGSVGPRVVRDGRLEGALAGKPYNSRSFQAVFPLVEEAISPIDDIRASAAYRIAASKNLLLHVCGQGP